MNIKDILKVSSLPVVLASLCCLTPVVIVLAGVGTVTFASTLADTLYGEYKWIFRAIGLSALLASLIVYLRRQKGICTIDDAVRRRNEVLNLTMIVLAAGVAGYFFFLYVVVHYIGVFLAIWN